MAQQHQSGTLQQQQQQQHPRYQYYKDIRKNDMEYTHQSRFTGRVQTQREPMVRRIPQNVSNEYSVDFADLNGLYPPPLPTHKQLPLQHITVVKSPQGETMKSERNDRDTSMNSRDNSVGDSLSDAPGDVSREIRDVCISSCYSNSTDSLSIFEEEHLTSHPISSCAVKGRSPKLPNNDKARIGRVRSPSRESRVSISTHSVADVESETMQRAKDSSVTSRCLANTTPSKSQNSRTRLFENDVHYVTTVYF